jgi:hypothetical protein
MVAVLWGTLQLPQGAILYLGHIPATAFVTVGPLFEKLLSALIVYNCESFAVTVVSTVIKTVLTIMVDCSAYKELFRGFKSETGD